MRVEKTAMTAEGMARGINEVANSFIDELSEQLAAVTLAAPVEELVFCAITLPPRLGSYPDQASYRGAAKSLLVSRNIPHDSWSCASSVERLGMYVSALREAISEAKTRYLKADDRQVLLAAIDQAGTLIRDRR